MLEEAEQRCTHVLWGFTNRSGVDEGVDAILVQHRVPGVKVAVEGAQAEHESPLDPEELEQILPPKAAVVDAVFDGGLAHALDHQHAFARDVGVDFRETETIKREIFLHALHGFLQTDLPSPFVSEVQLVEGVGFDVVQQGHRVPDLPQAG